MLWPTGSVEDSAEKVEGQGSSGARESENDSKEEEQPADLAATVTGLLAGLPGTLAGSQRIATSLRQKFASNTGKLYYNFLTKKNVIFFLFLVSRPHLQFKYMFDNLSWLSELKIHPFSIDFATYYDEKAFNVLIDTQLLQK